MTSFLIPILLIGLYYHNRSTINALAVSYGQSLLNYYIWICSIAAGLFVVGVVIDTPKITPILIGIAGTIPIIPLSIMINVINESTRGITDTTARALARGPIIALCYPIIVMGFSVLSYLCLGKYWSTVGITLTLCITILALMWNTYGVYKDSTEKFMLVSICIISIVIIVFAAINTAAPQAYKDWVLAKYGYNIATTEIATDNIRREVALTEYGIAEMTEDFNLLVPGGTSVALKRGDKVQIRGTAGVEVDICTIILGKADPNKCGFAPSLFVGGKIEMHLKTNPSEEESSNAYWDWFTN